ncbi:hypothetical protein NDN08_004560 [Rhodosorus marinus]|uniref:Cytochrome c oxidase assembly factor 3 n=1 Tax=Rhodosorus marinus TaxID=101924 RepID=A0AAV8ULS7_9RHOD|nr:hypothetical protein NDN08_004560 [Rhodosorus marinus]
MSMSISATEIYKEAKRLRASKLRKARRRETLIIYSMGVLAIFAGGSAVHRFYKPDLTLPNFDVPTELDSEIEAAQRRIQELKMKLDEKEL